jgi:hypothetical protein
MTICPCGRDLTGRESSGTRRNGITYCSAACLANPAYQPVVVSLPDALAEGTARARATGRPCYVYQPSFDSPTWMVGPFIPADDLCIECGPDGSHRLVCDGCGATTTGPLAGRKRT